MIVERYIMGFNRSFAIEPEELSVDMLVNPVVLM